MKYCTKCGNELFDEAVICPKCGCPVAPAGGNASVPAADRRDAKVKSASILNTVAFILNILMIAFLVIQFSAIWGEVLPERPDADYNVTVDVFTGSVTDIQDAEEEWNSEIAEIQQNQQKILLAGIIWGVLAIGTFALGIGTKRCVLASKGSKLAYLYMIFGVLTPVIPLLTANLLALLICGIGLVFFIPTVLQIIAGIKFLQGAK